MNKHTAFRLTSTENGKTGTTYTRNSRARIYSYCVVGVVYYRDGTTTEEVMWTSRMDLAQKKLQNMRTDWPAPETARTQKYARSTKALPGRHSSLTQFFKRVLLEERSAVRCLLESIQGRSRGSQVRAREETRVTHPASRNP